MRFESYTEYEPQRGDVMFSPGVAVAELGERGRESPRVSEPRSGDIVVSRGCSASGTHGTGMRHRFAVIFYQRYFDVVAL